ncbi:hypothetical protein NDU88_005662 [Pleurodeles waltl]|uniref:Uncharacterized protein n=1 Tax=Pleurodeles waltl TaxID=8319 RepID=A0AAV7UKN0_PLEWA|nr:hypothetical protein NDU88_005662 [Pleurodeles waltl]
MCLTDTTFSESRPRRKLDEPPGGRLRHWGRAALELRRARRGSARIPLRGRSRGTFYLTCTTKKDTSIMRQQASHTITDMPLSDSGYISTHTAKDDKIEEINTDMTV